MLLQYLSIGIDIHTAGHDPATLFLIRTGLVGGGGIRVRESKDRKIGGRHCESFYSYDDDDDDDGRPWWMSLLLSGVTHEVVG